jgi:two-component system NtrC family sensor kinase
MSGGGGHAGTPAGEAPLTPSGPQVRLREQASLLARVVAIIGLAFFAVELAVLATFTVGYWVWLTKHQRQELVNYASRVQEPVRRALVERGHPPDDASVDASLDAAVRSGRSAEAPSPGPTVLEPVGAPVDVWVLTRAGDVFRYTGGQLQAVDRAAWPGAEWGEPMRHDVDALFLGKDVAAQLETPLPYDAVVARGLGLATPIVSGGQGQPDAVLWLQCSLQDVQRQVATFGLVAFGSGAVALFITAMVVMHYLRRALLLPLSRLIAADNAARRGDERGAVIDEGDIPDDEVGAIMRSRNHLFLAMVKGRRDLDEKNAILARQGEELRRWGEQLERLVEQKSSALLRARDRLHRTEKLAALGRLAANVAHEINNPLASIAGYAEAARESLEGQAPGQGPEAAHVEAALRTIEEQAFRCKEILKRLLGLARSDQLELAPVDVGEVARESARLAEHAAARKGVALRLDLPAEGPVVHSDAASLQQVVVNLIDNAIDAAAADADPGAAPTVLPAAPPSVGPWVEVSLREAGDDVLLIVSDSGRGVPEALRSRVFDPFYTTKPVGRGTGLGLAISQSLVERLGGSLSVDQAPGGGAAFTVHVPRRPRASTRLPRQAASGEAALAAVEHLAAAGANDADPDAWGSRRASSSSRSPSRRRRAPRTATRGRPPSRRGRRSSSPT